MGRPPADLRIRRRNGRESGIVIQPYDEQRLRLLARWYCLTAEHVARFETAPSTETAEQFTDRVTGITTRLNKLSLIVPRGFVQASQTARLGPQPWSVTRDGAEWAEVPWDIRSGARRGYVQHALLAADVATQLHRSRLTLASEREISTSTEHTGWDLPNLTSRYWDSDAGKDRAAVPDIAILPPKTPADGPVPHGSRHIVVEVERQRGRVLDYYVRKLKAYAEDKSVATVWWFCTEASARRQIHHAAKRCHLRPEELRTGILAGPRHAIPWTDTQISDLNALGYNFAIPEQATAAAQSA